MQQEYRGAVSGHEVMQFDTLNVRGARDNGLGSLIFHISDLQSGTLEVNLIHADFDAPDGWRSHLQIAMDIQRRLHGET